MTPSLPGHPIDPEEEQMLQQMADHWRQVWNDAPVQSLTRIEEAARQVITITASLQGFYLAIFALSSLGTQMAQIHKDVPGWLFLLLFFLPPCCWLISLANATYVFVPRIRLGVNFNEVNTGAWQKVKDAYAQTAEEKLRALHRAHKWLIVSLVLVLLVILLFFVLPVLLT